MMNMIHLVPTHKAQIAGLSRLALASSALLFASCSPQAAEPAGVQSTSEEAQAEGVAINETSGLEVIPVMITTSSGRHAIASEVAKTPQEQARGLMFRTAMGANEGMIFPYSQAKYLSFWMRNTVIPLDIIYIGADNHVVNVAANAVPYSEAPIPSQGPAIAALELNAGRAAELGIEAGDKVEW